MCVGHMQTGQGLTLEMPRADCTYEMSAESSCVGGMYLLL